MTHSLSALSGALSALSGAFQAHQNPAKMAGAARLRLNTHFLREMGDCLSAPHRAATAPAILEPFFKRVLSAVLSAELGVIG